VFPCTINKNNEVCKSALDGSNQINLTNNPANDSVPDWSPPRFSLEGNKIVFESDRVGGLYQYEIFVMNSDGSDQTRLTYNQGNDLIPILSPDNKHVVFLSWQDGNSEVYLIGIDGSGQINLTNNPAFDQPAFWLPDGQIVFFSTRDGSDGKSYVMNSDGSNQVPYTP
jgi:Tol biopolymer transport system component